MTEQEAATAGRAGKPMLVFIYPETADDDDAPDYRFMVEEDAAFADDKVAMGARFFDCLRIDAETARTDRVLKSYASTRPTLVFLRPNYEATKMVRTTKKFNAGKIVAAMRATLKLDYQNKLSRVASAQKSIQKERAKTDKLRAKLNELEQTIADTKSASKRAKLNKQRDALDKKIGDLEDAANTREAALYELKPTPAKA